MTHHTITKSIAGLALGLATLALGTDVASALEGPARLSTHGTDDGSKPVTVLRWEKLQVP